MRAVDIVPFALPNHPLNELRFEEPRDVARVVARFRAAPPKGIGVSYLRRDWPHRRIEQFLTMETDRPARFGWVGIDDQFNSSWQAASVQARQVAADTVEITFDGLRRELAGFPGEAEYDVRFRRTLGLRLDGPEPTSIRALAVYTVSPPVGTRLKVQLDAGAATPGRSVRLSAYNAFIEQIDPGAGAAVAGRTVTFRGRGPRSFTVDLRHMQPLHHHSNDDALLTLCLEADTFTVSLTALAAQGPVWFQELGVLVSHADDPTGLAEYRARWAASRTVAQQVLALREQTFGGAFHAQPNPHPDGFIVGCPRSRHHFWIEPDGDLILCNRVLQAFKGKDSDRFLNDQSGRFFFGLQRWVCGGRFNDPPPMLAYNLLMKAGDLVLDQKVFAIPLEKSLGEGELDGDDTLVGFVRFRLRNAGDRDVVAELPVGYSAQSGRAYTPLQPRVAQPGQDDDLVPASPREALRVVEDRLVGTYQGRDVLRAAFESDMRPTPLRRGEILFRRKLRPGGSCELVLKVPFIALETRKELKALRRLDVDASYAQAGRFWGAVGRRGAEVVTPEPNLNAAYRLHLPIVLISDPKLPDGSGLINTSVGTATYGNFCNESCMVQQELDQRGLHDEARRRLEVYLRYQGQGEMAGDYDGDYRGLLFSTGGFDGGKYYNQNHGWVLWRLAEHFFMTGDRAWLAGVADQLVQAADWVFRHRRRTLGKRPFSRGWERGFAPAAGLEDVGDFHYWLVNNLMFWRGCDWTAHALAEIGHPQARRLRRETDAYRRDLLRGVAISRQHSPLVRLRDGRWVPHFPSRLYRRGRDVGWIREVLEGSVYLLLSGLLEPRSREGGWILDDFQDNRYMTPPFGYNIEAPETCWFARGGFSVQPNLLAGLLPYLDRDEPELYIWMFFNAWCACYREGQNAMVEHPMPFLGFSNNVPFKTSDQSNAMKWLVYMYVCTVGNVLHLGRALPRYWLEDGCDIAARSVCTTFGVVSVRYRSEADAGVIRAEVGLRLRQAPGRILLRFRHPAKKALVSVLVNGRRHARFDHESNDVDLTGYSGELLVVAAF